jgi:general secretion pathway protein D
MPKFFSKSRFTAAILALSLLQPSLLTDARADPGQVIEQIEFRDITVGDALRILSEQSDLNIIASKEAAEIQVTMFLRRVTSMEVIDAIAKTYNLWYQRDFNSNIVRIYTVKEYRLEQVEFKKEETEIFTMKNAKNALDLAETIKNLFSERVTLSYGKNEREIMTDLSQRFQRFNMIDGRSTLTSSRGGSGGGGGGNTGGNSGNSTSISAGSGGMLGNQVGVSARGQENSNREIELEEQLRVSTDILRKFADSKDGTQGLITGDIAQSSGLLDQTIRHQAPIYVGVIKHQNRVLVRTRDQDAMAEIRQLYKKLDTESSMLLMEVKVLSIDLSDGYDSLFDFKVKTNNANVATLGASNTIGAQEIFDTGLRAASAAFDPSLLATVVSNNFEARLQLLEKEGRVTELATPMLMTTNQEVSRVFVGEERPIISGYSASATVASGAGLGTGNVVQQPILVPETDVRAIGTTLLLTPNINSDRTVGIQILVEQSTLSAAKGTIPVQIGETLQDANIDLVQERTFSGTIVAKDSTAVAVGGLIQEAASNSEKKVPILGDIPILGFFFREDGQSRTRRELVIIIKPHIMETPTEAAGVSHEVLEENSIHPNALDAGSMDVYSNPDRRHKGYVLEQPFKEYSKQDVFDKYRGRGDSREFPENRRAASPSAAAPAPSPAQQIYVDLTRYASEAIRLPPEQRKIDPKITPVRLSEFEPVDLTYDSRIKALPIAGWRQGGIYVTAVELHNVSNDRVTVDYRRLKGRWLASTIENETLAGQTDQSHATTYLYLISSQPFEEIVAPATH